MSRKPNDSQDTNYYISSSSTSILGNEVLPGEKPPNAIFIPRNRHASSQNQNLPHSKHQLTPNKAQKSRPLTTCKNNPNQIPPSREEKKVVDHFMGAKRAFLASHKRKCYIANEVLERTWKTQEKSRQWEYKREYDQLTTNIKLRDDESLRRLNKPRPKHGEIFVPSTTGPRLAKKLPREIQNTTYPRNHVFYFGA